MFTDTGKMAPILRQVAIANRVFYYVSSQKYLGFFFLRIVCHYQINPSSWFDYSQCLYTENLFSQVISMKPDDLTI